MVPDLKFLPVLRDEGVKVAKPGRGGMSDCSFTYAKPTILEIFSTRLFLPD
jgi:hypothetical protein